MNANTNPIIAKIEKLLRLSRDQDGTHEGETAARLASRMMLAHAIEAADLDIDGEVKHDPLETQGIDMPTSVWRRLLAQEVARHCNCKMAYQSWRGRGCMTVTIYGHRSDIEVARYLYAICERQIEEAAKAHMERVAGDHTMGPRRSVGNSFRRSAVSGLGTKLYNIRRDTRAEAAPESYALVVTRKAKVDAWVAETFSFRRGSDGGYGYSSAGYSAGQNVSLSAGVGSRTAGSIGSTKRLNG